MIRRLAIPTLLLVAGFAMGWSLAPSWRGGDTGPAGASPGDEKREHAVARGIPGIAGGDAAERVDGLLAEAFRSGAIDYRSMRALMLALARLSPESIPEFVEFFNGQEFRKEQILLWRMFFSGWGEFDAEGATEFVGKRFEDAAARRIFYAAIIETWRDGSMENALEFALSNFQAADSPFDASLAIDYLRELAASDPEEALSLAQRLHDGEFVLELTGRRIAALARQNREAALDAIGALEGELQIHAASEFIAEWSKEEPAAAAEWLSAHYESRLGVRTLTQVASAYVKTDPVGAMRWIAGLSDAGTREIILAEAIKAWAAADATAAAAWLRKSEVRAENDAAVIALGSGLAPENPRGVIEEWVPRVADPAKGNALLYEVSLEWQRDQPGEYSHWLEQTTSLSPEVKQRLVFRELPGAGGAGETSSTGGPPAAPLNQGREERGEDGAR